MGNIMVYTYAVITVYDHWYQSLVYVYVRTMVPLVRTMVLKYHGTKWYHGTPCTTWYMCKTHVVLSAHVCQKARVVT